MRKKSISIDQRLSSVLNFICEKDGLNPEILESDDKITFYAQDVKDIKELKSTIDYLKDYAKLQTISKSFSNQKGLLKDIENAQSDFQKLIEEKQLQISNMPRVKKRSKKIYIYHFEDEFEELEEKRYKEECAKRKNKILSLKQDIKIYQGKIRKLESLKKSLSKPEKLMEILFPEEYTNVKENYARLINLCVASMTDGFSSNDLIGDDKVFKFDGKNYKVNYNNARKFLSVIKSKKELLAATQYIENKRNSNTLYLDYEDTKKNISNYEVSYQMSHTAEFSWVTNNMNQIIDKYNDLVYYEEKKDKNFFSKIGNMFRYMFKLPKNKRVSKKIWQLRADLSNSIKNFTTQVKSNKNLEKAFYAYQTAAKVSNRPYYISITELEWAIPEVKHHGIARVDFPLAPIYISDLRLNVKSALEKENSSLEYYNNELNKFDETQSELYLNLSSKTKKILEKCSEEEILKYAKTYYGFGKNALDNEDLYKCNLSPSSAAIILESILGRKNISWESIVDNYASILGNHNLENERIDMDTIIDNKVDSLKEHLVSMVQVEKDEAR